MFIVHTVIICKENYNNIDNQQIKQRKGIAKST